MEAEAAAAIFFNECPPLKKEVSCKNRRLYYASKKAITHKLSNYKEPYTPKIRFFGIKLETIHECIEAALKITQTKKPSELEKALEKAEEALRLIDKMILESKAIKIISCIKEMCLNFVFKYSIYKYEPTPENIKEICKNINTEKLSRQKRALEKAIKYVSKLPPQLQYFIDIQIPELQKLFTSLDKNKNKFALQMAAARPMKESHKMNNKIEGTKRLLNKINTTAAAVEKVIQNHIQPILADPNKKCYFLPSRRDFTKIFDRSLTAAAEKEAELELVVAEALLFLRNQ